MNFEIIEHMSDLEQFNDKFTAYTNFQLPIKYWQHCKMVACYSSNRTMIGGYALVLEPPFRSLWALSAQPEVHERFCQQIPLKQMIEVTGLWIEPGAMSIRQKASFFRFFVNDICHCDRTYLLYVYNLERQDLQRLYGKMKPTVLFRGNLSTPSNSNNHPVGIEYACISDLKEERKHYRWGAMQFC